MKSAVCGSGRADKAQVAFMVAQTLGFREKLPADASDALAVALCHSVRGTGHVAAAIPPASAARAGLVGWKSLSPEDLAAMGYRLEGGGK